MVTWADGGDPVVTGTEAMTTPGGYQFAVTGGNGPYTWSISGTGASIDQNGYVTLSGACGSFFVTCTDCTGRSFQHAGTRVTNNGSWTAGNQYFWCGNGNTTQEVISCRIPCSQYYALSGYDYGNHTEERYSGIYWISLTWTTTVGYRYAYCAPCPECSPSYGSVRQLFLDLINADCAYVEGIISAEYVTVIQDVCSPGYENYLFDLVTTSMFVKKWGC